LPDHTVSGTAALFDEFSTRFLTYAVAVTASAQNCLGSPLGFSMDLTKSIKVLFTLSATLFICGVSTFERSCLMPNFLKYEDISALQYSKPLSFPPSSPSREVKISYENAEACYKTPRLPKPLSVRIILTLCPVRRSAILMNSFSLSAASDFAFRQATTILRQQTS
ncbi:hypothetical protein M514_28431, partial [Trichuris suis]